jgi:hypothetical protein
MRFALIFKGLLWWRDRASEIFNCPNAHHAEVMSTY